MDGMSAVTDTHAVVKQLQEAGVEERQAEVIVHAISDAVGDAVTKADLAPLATKTEIAFVPISTVRCGCKRPALSA